MTTLGRYLESALEILIVWRSDAIFEALTLVASFDNVTLVREAAKKCGCHFGIAEN
jgi:hypothetical protein